MCHLYTTSFHLRYESLEDRIFRGTDARMIARLPIMQLVTDLTLPCEKTTVFETCPTTSRKEDDRRQYRLPCGMLLDKFPTKEAVLNRFAHERDALTHRVGDGFSNNSGEQHLLERHFSSASSASGTDVSVGGQGQGVDDRPCYQYHWKSVLADRMHRIIDILQNIRDWTSRGLGGAPELELHFVTDGVVGGKDVPFPLPPKSFDRIRASERLHRFSQLNLAGSGLELCCFLDVYVMLFELLMYDKAFRGCLPGTVADGSVSSLCVIVETSACVLDPVFVTLLYLLYDDQMGTAAHLPDAADRNLQDIGMTIRRQYVMDFLRAVQVGVFCCHPETWEVRINRRRDWCHNCRKPHTDLGKVSSKYGVVYAPVCRSCSDKLYEEAQQRSLVEDVEDRRTTPTISTPNTTVPSASLGHGGGGVASEEATPPPASRAKFNFLEAAKTMSFQEAANLSVGRTSGETVACGSAGERSGGRGGSQRASPVGMSGTPSGRSESATSARSEDLKSWHSVERRSASRDKREDRRRVVPGSADANATISTLVGGTSGSSSDGTILVLDPHVGGSGSSLRGRQLSSSRGGGRNCDDESPEAIISSSVANREGKQRWREQRQKRVRELIGSEEGRDARALPSILSSKLALLALGSAKWQAQWRKSPAYDLSGRGGVGNVSAIAPPWRAKVDVVALIRDLEGRPDGPPFVGHIVNKLLRSRLHPDCLELFEHRRYFNAQLCTSIVHPPTKIMSNDVGLWESAQVSQIAAASSCRLVFGYASLVWKVDFPVVRSFPCFLPGRYWSDLCILQNAAAFLCVVTDVVWHIRIHLVRCKSP